MPGIRQLWITITSSLWFVPLSMVGGAIFFAIALTVLDVAIGDDWTDKRPVLFGVGADGARGMLAAIAGSMITVASLTFSLTISTLAIMASQYTSRLVRNFMRDRVNQFVLGYFVGLFAYCLVVLRSIRGGDEDQFVPPLAVLTGLLFALFSIIVLIIFIHHIAESIQVSTILGGVTRETVDAIEDLYPFDKADAPAADDDTVLPLIPQSRRREVLARTFGYVQDIDVPCLVQLAAEHNALIALRADVGGFVTPGGALCEIELPAPPDEALAEAVRAAFSIGAVRTIEQDPAFGVRQVVDIGLRALSPGVNDTTTGVMCIEHISAMLEALAGRPIPDRFRTDDGRVRLVVADRTFAAFLGLCLDQIRQSASGNPAVLSALLRAIAAAGRYADPPGRRRSLAEQARLIGDLADEGLCPSDRQPVQTLAATVVADLAGARSAPPLGEGSGPAAP